MTKKHFEAFAREIADSAGWADREQRVFAARIVIVVAEQSNSRFDRSRFLKACGLESA